MALVWQFFVVAINCFLLLIPSGSAHAQTMSNQNYIIQTQEINATTNVADTEKPESKIDPLLSEGVNFKVKSGFENPSSTLPFSILLSSNIVNFGILSPTDPVIRTVDLDIYSLKTHGYSVIVFENKPLTIIPPAESDSAPTNSAFIPNTTCDNGECSAENSSEWTNALTYGFGYRCDNVIGVDCDSSFVTANFYKHFPDIANNDDPQPIMSGIGSDNKEIRVSYKINTSGTQTQGIYSNVTTYIAVPNF